jgi:hypothetical protein
VPQHDVSPQDATHYDLKGMFLHMFCLCICICICICSVLHYPKKPSIFLNKNGEMEKWCFSYDLFICPAKTCLGGQTLHVLAI